MAVIALLTPTCVRNSLLTDMAKQTIIYVKCCAGGSFVWVYFYLLRLSNFCLLNLFIYVVLGYHIWGWNKVVYKLDQIFCACYVRLHLARSSSGDNANVVSYILWMTSRLHITGRHRRREWAYAQNDSPREAPGAKSVVYMDDCLVVFRIWLFCG